MTHQLEIQHWISKESWLKNSLISQRINWRSNFNTNVLLKTLWPLFHGWRSTYTGLEPLQGGSLLFTTKFPEISGTDFIELGRMKS